MATTVQVETQIDSRNGWIVHENYGVGRIRGKEVKYISGEENEYYRIELANGTIWVPVDDYDDDKFRALASEKEFDEALEALQREPRAMDGNFQRRKAKIRKAKAKNSLLAIACMVRDLTARRSERSLSNTEERALRKFTERLVVEWSTCRDIGKGEARKRLHNLLNTVK